MEEYQRVKKFKPRKCYVCGKEYLPIQSRQKCCSDGCSRKLNNERNKERQKNGYYKQYLEERRSIKSKNSHSNCDEQKKSKPELTISQIQEAANKEYLTYGQYVSKYKL